MGAQISQVDGLNGAVAIKAFEKIADAWRLSAEERLVLLGLPSSTYYRYRKDPSSARGLSRDTFERISHVLGIHKALHVLFAQAEYADRWIKEPNQAFGGNSALSHMLGGNVTDVADVRRYLDAQRGW